jgi:diguanylate cyclase (GGDEF)-like protein/PAS domain S-box-containing protein
LASNYFQEYDDPLIMKTSKSEKNTYKAIIDNIDEGVYFVDRDRKILYWNKGAERISGFTSEQVQGRFCHDNILNHVTENGTQLCLHGCPLHATIADGNPRQAEVFLHHSSGHLVPILVRTSPLRDDNGDIIGAVETFSDNSKLMTIRHQLRRLEDIALQDHLTGIGNRRFMERRLQTALLEYKQQDTPFGVLFMDIDNFKKINDTYGHKTGDQVLIMVANTLHSYLRSDDSVARWGGEEFLAILPGLDEDGLKSVAEKLIVLVANSILRLKERNLSVTISIGMTFAQLDDTIQSIVERADTNMYKSKRAGRNRVTADEPSGESEL